jgi:hypothetical protein
LIEKSWDKSLPKTKNFLVTPFSEPQRAMMIKKKKRRRIAYEWIDLFTDKTRLVFAIVQMQCGRPSGTNMYLRPAAD